MRIPLAAPLTAALVLVACQPDTVKVAFRPAVGTQYQYEVRVRSVTTTRLGGAPEERSVDDTVLRADHVVLAGGPEGVRVRVQLQRRGSPPRTFVVRFDRAAQLEEVETIEGLPASVLGRLDLPEIFPAAAGAPPDRPLAAGERWQTDEPLRLPGGRQSRLQANGRLVSLEVVDGRKLATIRSQTRLPLTSTTEVRGGQLSLDGVEVSGIDAKRDLADGSVTRASAVTRGAFRLVLAPPSGSPGSPVEGTLEVEVRSQTRRLTPAGGSTGG